MDATCTIQDSIHVFSLVHKYVSRILGTYHLMPGCLFSLSFFIFNNTYNFSPDGLQYTRLTGLKTVH